MVLLELGLAHPSFSLYWDWSEPYEHWEPPSEPFEPYHYSPLWSPLKIGPSSSEVSWEGDLARHPQRSSHLISGPLSWWHQLSTSMGGSCISVTSISIWLSISGPVCGPWSFLGTSYSLGLIGMKMNSHLFTLILMTSQPIHHALDLYFLGQNLHWP